MIHESLNSMKDKRNFTVIKNRKLTRVPSTKKNISIKYHDL